MKASGEMHEVSTLTGMQENTVLAGDINMTRSLRAHSEAHRFYRTGCPVRCDQAGRRAARRLITPAAMLAAARYETRITVIARTLWVTAADVTNYIASLDPDEWLIMRRLVGHELV